MGACCSSDNTNEDLVGLQTRSNKIKQSLQNMPVQKEVDNDMIIGTKEPVKQID